MTQSTAENTAPEAAHPNRSMRSDDLRQRLSAGLHRRDVATWSADTAEEAAHNESNTGLSRDALEIARSLRDDSVSVPVLTGSVRAADLVIIVASAIGASMTEIGATSLGGIHAIVVCIALVFAMAFLQAADAYQVPTLRRGMSQFGRIAASWTMVFVMLAVIRITTGFGSGVSQQWAGVWFLTAMAGLIGGRLVVARLVQVWMGNGRLERRAVIVGGGTAAADLIHELEAQPDNDIRICGIFDDRSNDRSPPVVAGYPKLGNISALVEFARMARIDMLIVCIPLRAEKRVLELLRKLWVLPVDIRLSAHTDKVRFRNRGSSFIGTVPFVDVVEKPITDWDMVAKRIFDIAFASAAIVALFPVMIATAIAIRMESKGPILFRQKRYGFNNEIIEVLKFRSMFHEMADPDAKTVVTKGDPRVTRVGRFIRKTSIDELPQLFNVLAGSLSLVGPRPHAVNAHTDNKTWDDVVDGYFARHKVKPGVTGWAQINGWRGEVDTPEKIEKRVECDVYYIENWSILFDLKILFLTPFRLLNTENAY
jgi:Undecaprenyl-phosphate glucose phosphotransferase